MKQQYPHLLTGTRLMKKKTDVCMPQTNDFNTGLREISLDFRHEGCTGKETGK